MRATKAMVKFGGKEFTCKAYITLGARKPPLGKVLFKQTGLLYNPPSELKLPIK